MANPMHLPFAMLKKWQFAIGSDEKALLSIGTRSELNNRAPSLSMSYISSYVPYKYNVYVIKTSDISLKNTYFPTTTVFCCRVNSRRTRGRDRKYVVSRQRYTAMNMLEYCTEVLCLVLSTQSSLLYYRRVSYIYCSYMNVF